MSNETELWLQTNVLVGDCSIHGNPWHSPGVRVTKNDSTNLYPGAVPIKRVRELLGFPVELIPHTYTLTTGPLAGKTFTRGQDLVHAGTGHLFGTFAEGYTDHPYAETLIDNVATIVGDSTGDLHVDSAGLLAMGGQAWLSLSTAGLLSTPEGVDYWPHILASTSRDGTLSTTYKAVNTMVVCDNTRAMALGEKTPTFKIKHTKYSLTKLADAKAALGLLEQSADGFAAEVKMLCEQTVTDAQWAAFVEALAPITDATKPAGITRAESQRARLTELYKSDERCAPWTGTAFGALQAANVNYLWDRGTRGAGDDEQNAKADRVISEAIRGKLDTVEQSYATTLGGILANA